MSVQPIHYIPAPQPLPTSGNQPGGGQPQPQFYPSLQPVPVGPFLPQVVTTPFTIGVTKAHALIGLGIIQVILGTASILSNGISYHWHTATTWVGPGLWGGILFVVSGAFGIVAGLKKTKTMVITTLVMAAISAVFAGVQFTLAIISLGKNEQRYRDYPGYYRSLYGDDFYSGVMGVDGVLLVAALLQAGAAIPSSSLACDSICCSEPPTVPYAGAHYNQQMAYPMQFQPQPGFIIAPQTTTAPYHHHTGEPGPPAVQVSTDLPPPSYGELTEPK